MSLLQMAGGVAVAGVVAAGASAFTATAGITVAGAKAPILGGTGAITMNATNARLLSSSFDLTPASNDILGLTVTLDDGNTHALATTSTVKVALTGTPFGSAPLSTVYYACASGTVVGNTTTFVCDVPNDYYTDVTAASVWVAPVPV